jgi:hypothetical protein
MKRDLSGVFIFETNEEGKREPTCFEECSEETQKKWLESLDIEAIKSLALHLGKVINNIGEEFNLQAGYESTE